MGFTILFVGILYFTAHFFQILFDRTRIPDVLFLILLGLAIGPWAGWVSVEDFGKAGPVLTTMALVVLLFEGGTDLTPRDLGRGMHLSAPLTLTTFLMTGTAFTLAAHWWLDWPWMAAALQGTILGGTSAAVVLPLLRGLHSQEPIRSSLVLESALTDVLSIVLTLGLLGAATSGHLDPGHLVGRMISSLVIASVIGILAGIGWLVFLGTFPKFPNTRFSALAIAFMLYGFNEWLGYSGGIAALAFGAALASWGKPGRQVKLPGFLRRINGRALASPDEEQRVFWREMVFLLKTFFFLFLGLSLPVKTPQLLLPAALTTLAIYAIRPILVWAFFRGKASVHEMATASILIPKGLAAAVLAGMVMLSGFPLGEPIRQFTYWAILVSIVLTTILTPLTRSKIFVEKETEKTGLRAAKKSTHRKRRT